MIDTTAPLAVTLDRQQWQQVLNVLAEGGPWRIVNPLIQSIAEQVQAADDASQAPAPAPQPPLTNGVDAHVRD